MNACCWKKIALNPGKSVDGIRRRHHPVNEEVAITRRVSFILLAITRGRRLYPDSIANLTLVYIVW